MSTSNKKVAANQINVATYLRRMGKVQPFKRAVCYPAGRDERGRVAYSHLTFIQLEQESDSIAYGLEKTGILRGTRTILMVKPSLALQGLTTNKPEEDILEVAIVALQRVLATEKANLEQPAVVEGEEAPVPAR